MPHTHHLAPLTPHPDRAVLPILPSEEQKGFLWTPGLKAVLDIGSTKITCLIGQGLKNGGLRVLSWGWRRSEGVTSGAIVDTKQLERVIRATVGDAERKIHRHIRDVTVNLSCGKPRSYHLDAYLTPNGREVNDADVHTLYEQARYEAMEPDRRIVHAMPLGFNIDDSVTVLNPCGHQCERLMGKFHIIDAQTGVLHTLDNLLQRAELRAVDILSSPIASGIAVTDHDERDLGVTVVDMGAGTTTLAVFARGRVLYTRHLRVGSHHITNDIARALTIPIDAAERLKTLYGVAYASADDASLPIALPLPHHSGIRHITRADIVRAIAPRVEETLEMLRHELNGAGLGHPAEGPVILTGGGALLNGLDNVAAEILNRPIQVRPPTAIRGLPQSSHPSIWAGFSTAAGLLAWSAGARNSFCLADQNAPPRGFGKRLASLLRKK
ncbi:MULTISPECIES: cell division protein FtsA [Bombella]|uniref:Cell division protein FtsA n=1 Tax=Bombella pollinis TaxID=2967337 RepID=A0ABT3WL56_9PROT|nr:MULTISPECIES: cell division protein FtsA [Bombella]MCT6838884.1 cell division protein FtsA [Bifidobacteriales bacterium]MCX5619413.1 cell division protein FtsA [Bombella pollinis]MUG04886.1 cell division protein FtsA [Bombella sp. ESL0378]MUG90427.1 cell division protein FtsA [Bombella sp. ESL0385]